MEGICNYLKTILSEHGGIQYIHAGYIWTIAIGLGGGGGGGANVYVHSHCVLHVKGGRGSR